MHTARYDLCAAWRAGPQAYLAVFMKKHHGVLAVLAEVMLVVTGLKAGVEVWRLARGEEHDPGAPVDPKMAGIAGKVVERVFESIPGAMLTAATLLGTGDQLSDIVTIYTLFRLGLLGPAYALLTMVLVSFAAQVWSQCVALGPLRRLAAWWTGSAGNHRRGNEEAPRRAGGVGRGRFGRHGPEGRS